MILLSGVRILLGIIHPNLLNGGLLKSIPLILPTIEVGLGFGMLKFHKTLNTSFVYWFMRISQQIDLDLTIILCMICPLIGVVWLRNLLCMLFVIVAWWKLFGLCYFMNFLEISSRWMSMIRCTSLSLPLKINTGWFLVGLFSSRGMLKFSEIKCGMRGW